MSRRIHLWWLIPLPALLLAALYVLGLQLSVPHLGRAYVLRITLPEAGSGIGLPEVAGPQDARRPLVVIDPGHGGHDPGASTAGYREKDVVLGLALALRDRLVEQGAIRVALTREDDRFLALGERAEIARRLDADLFLSIHADSAGDARDIAGATIYTLSEKASDEAAARLAARENRADRLNGVSLEGRSDAVSNILVDLSQRRTREASAEFARLIAREGRDQLEFHLNPLRSAAFVVLKSPDVPSVLFEAGYITNPEQARRLASTDGREAFADALAKAIRVYLARQSRN